MNTVGRNLKQLRLRAELTQDALAERLHVTRQAVSSWETGKTQPDIETLAALAEALGSDIREVIYGPQQPGRPYARCQRKYVICCGICGAVVLASLLVWGIAEPMMAERMKRFYDIFMPYYLLGAATAMLRYAGLGCLAMALVSLWADLRLSRRTRGIVLIAAAVLLAVYLLWGLTVLLGPNCPPLLMQVWYMLAGSGLLRNGLVFLAGSGLFLGLNR